MIDMLKTVTFNLGTKQISDFTNSVTEILIAIGSRSRVDFILILVNPSDKLHKKVIKLSILLKIDAKKGYTALHLASALLGLGGIIFLCYEKLCPAPCVRYVVCTVIRDRRLAPATRRGPGQFERNGCAVTNPDDREPVIW